jgi:hypothetical protein
VQVLEAQMLPATAPFYMGLAAGWAIFVSSYVHHTGGLARSSQATAMLLGAARASVSVTMQVPCLGLRPPCPSTLLLHARPPQHMAVAFMLPCNDADCRLSSN